MPKTDVIAQGGGQWAGHVTQRALIMVHCGKQLGENITTEQGEHRLESFSWDSGPLLTVVPHVVTKQPFCSEPLGTVRTLKPLLCSNGTRKRGEGEVRKGPKQRVEHTEQQMRKKG